jgi:hypothetical protein
MDDFKPSKVSIDTFSQLMREMKGGHKPHSQCFNRAHYWAWQLDSKLKVKTVKVFIFFRKEFIQIDKFDWWFHVAPGVYLDGEDSEIQILDKFLWDGPVPISYWQTHFLRMGGSDRDKCKMITRYSDYVNNTFKEHCYIMFAAQQYWQPFELEKLEKDGIRKAPEMNMKEVLSAKRQAFWF